MTDLESSSELIARIATLIDMKVRERTEFGERLHKARERAGLKQDELARRAGMAQSNISQLETTGTGSMKVATLAELTGVRVAWLADGTGPMLEGDDPVARAAERAASYLTPSHGRDYRTLAHTLADALEQTGTELSVRQFLTLVDRLADPRK